MKNFYVVSQCRIFFLEIGIWIRIQQLDPDSPESSDNDSVNPDPQYLCYFSEIIVHL